MSNAALARRGRSYNLDKRLTLDPPAKTPTASQVATSLEALDAAVYLDDADDTVAKILVHHGFDHKLFTPANESDSAGVPEPRYRFTNCVYKRTTTVRASAAKGGVT